MNTQVLAKPIPFMKSVGPLILPFLKSSAIYFIVSKHFTDYKFIFSILKCAPILALLIFVISRCIKSRKVTSYRALVGLGLVLSAFGDIFLVYSKDGYLIHGIVAFGIAQIIYTCAFGFKHINMKLFVLLATIGVIVYSIMYPFLRGLVVIAIPSYMAMLGCMIWRAISRADLSKGIFSSDLLPAIGSLIFMISDLILGLSMFGIISFVHSHHVVMVTYYLAQMCIALSCTDCESI